MRKIGRHIIRTSIILFVGVLVCMTACVQEQKGPTKDNISSCEVSFFGDSTAVFKANTLQNGYKISIIHNKQLNVIQMSQGRVIDIIIIGGSYSLQYYSFWKGKMDFRFLMW